MSEELEKSVSEMLREESWTRTAISSIKENSLKELDEILAKAKQEGSESRIKEICDEQLGHSKDSIIALYLSGIIGLKTGSLDNTNLETLVEIFNNNHKEALIEKFCDKIISIDEKNLFALRTRASYYKTNNDNRVWTEYAAIVKIDPEDAETAKALGDHYKENADTENAMKYYKTALNRYINGKNFTAVRSTWKLILDLTTEIRDLDYFLSIQRKVAKSISEDKSSSLIQDLYDKINGNTGDINSAMAGISAELLKLELKIDNNDSAARRDLIECYKELYKSHSHLDDYIRLSGLNLSSRNVFEAISAFEKHIAFDAGNFVFHKTWGVGKITKVEGETITINFGKTNGQKSMSLQMATTALQPLSKDHIWVKKATTRKEVLVEDVEKNYKKYLEIIIKSFPDSCDDKRIKAELVPSILTPAKWTSWHSKAQKELATNPYIGVNPNNINAYIWRDKELTQAERLGNEFKAEKDFFARIDIMFRYASVENVSLDTDTFLEMAGYFNSYLKVISEVDVQVVASYLALQNLSVKHPEEFSFDPKFTFEQMYGEIQNPKEMYTLLKDTKNTELKADFIKNVKNLSNWNDEYIRLFPTVLDLDLISTLNASGFTSQVQSLVQNAFNEYRNYRECAIFLFKECRDQEWFNNSGVSYEKQLITLVNIISLCYREIANHVNTTDNKKIIKNASILLFEEKAGESKVNNMLQYMLDSNSQEVINRMYTMVNDVKDLEPKYKTDLRNGILGKYPDFKFQEAETKQEAPKGLLCTSKMLDEKKKLADDMEKVQLPKIAEEIAEAKEKGDLKENAEFLSAKEAQKITSSKLNKLKSELSRAVPFDPSTVTTSVISFGTTVVLTDNATGNDLTYTILGPWESNPDAGIISYLSPLGDKLLDGKTGDKLVFKINDNKYDLTVKSIAAAKLN